MQGVRGSWTKRQRAKKRPHAETSQKGLEHVEVKQLHVAHRVVGVGVNQWLERKGLEHKTNNTVAGIGSDLAAFG